MDVEFPVATTPAPGLHGVDWENRVDFDRLRDYRLARVRQQLESSDLGAVLALLPALQRPTISPLSDDDWVAINTIIEERTVRDLIPKLKAAHAQGIVEYPLNKIVL